MQQQRNKKEKDLETLNEWKRGVDLTAAHSDHIEPLMAIAAGVFQLRKPFPNLHVSLAKTGGGTYSLTFSRWNREVSCQTLYEALLDHTVRDARYQSIVRVMINPHACTVTLDVAFQARRMARGGARRRRHVGKRSRYAQDMPIAGQEEAVVERAQQRVGEGTGRVMTVELKEDKLDLSEVDPAHHSAVRSAVVATMFFNPVMPQVPPPNIRAADIHYKLSFAQYDTELDVAEVYRRILSRTTNQPEFRLVIDCGFETRRNTFYLRMAKLAAANHSTIRSRHK